MKNSAKQDAGASSKTENRTLYNYIRPNSGEACKPRYFNRNMKNKSTGDIPVWQKVCTLRKRYLNKPPKTAELILRAFPAAGRRGQNKKSRGAANRRINGDQPRPCAFAL
jgi:hypothetical protein